MDNLFIVIPAIKKNAVIPDQLVKKLDGITLIQRAINIAKEITNKILIVTDSEEISVIAKRNNVKSFYDKTLFLDPNTIRNELKPILKKILPSKADIFLYRANTPLITKEILKNAYDYFVSQQRKNIVISSKTETKNIFINEGKNLSLKFASITEEIKAFQIFTFYHLDEKPFLIDTYNIPIDKAVEIRGYQDWWVCDRLLKRKKIVFNVVGSKELGMGHIYRSLTLAHDINDHEIIFVCNKKYSLVVESIASKDYPVFIFENENEIINLKPDLVINDVLNTSEEYIKMLKKNDIKVLNFEDLGSGSKFADFTINELYETPKIKGNNFLWGSEYFFLRDEFDNAKPNTFTNDVRQILISFGGTDQNNLTLISLKSILPILVKNNINVQIVCGAGYLHKDELERFIAENRKLKIKVHYATETISQVMEQTQIAICSNGRTVYELADMNIPAIVVAHHDRENGHSFATLDKGFVNLGVISDSIDDKIKTAFGKLVNDRDYRYLLFINIAKYGFRENKAKIINLINDLIK